MTVRRSQLTWKRGGIYWWAGIAALIAGPVGGIFGWAVFQSLFPALLASVVVGGVSFGVPAFLANDSVSGYENAVGDIIGDFVRAVTQELGQRKNLVEAVEDAGEEFPIIRDEVDNLVKNLELGMPPRAALLAFAADLNVPFAYSLLEQIAEAMEHGGDLERPFLDLSRAADFFREWEKDVASGAKDFVRSVGAIFAAFLGTTAVLMGVMVPMFAKFSSQSGLRIFSLSLDVSVLRDFLLVSDLVAAVAVGLWMGRLMSRRPLSGLKYTFAMIGATTAVFVALQFVHV